MDPGQRARQPAVAGHRVEQARDRCLRGDRHRDTPGQRGGYRGQHRQPLATGRFGDLVEGGVRRLEVHPGGEVGGQPGLRDEDAAHDEQRDQRGAADLPGGIALDLLGEGGDGVEAEERQYGDRGGLHHQAEIEGFRAIQRFEGQPAVAQAAFQRLVADHQEDRQHHQLSDQEQQVGAGGEGDAAQVDQVAETRNSSIQASLGIAGNKWFSASALNT